ncbi:MAG: chondroitinase-B domain-containing protein [Dermatophilaceae bacterium]|nr:right-handed parallel beta-helix repeat-containing protein [Candidatus Lutibacillus vidarii]
MVQTSDELGTAIANAKPGDVIALAAGTYSGRITIKGSGTKAAPITIEAEGSGPVTLTASLPMPPCGASGPDENRTVTFIRGASWWTLRGVTISGGVMVAGVNANLSSRWFTSKVAAGDWASRRAIPGRGVNDPTAAVGALVEVSRIVGATIIPSDGITLDGVTVTRKGVHSRASRYGTIRNSTIQDIACGTGPGIWLGNYSDGWTITGTTVRRVAASTLSHYMQEGIRIGGASNYNLVSGNTVSDLPGDGRAFTTDVDASFNVFRANQASGVAIGYNEQASGWGNIWEYNTVSQYRKAGFSVRMKDNVLSNPSRNTSSYDILVRCNVASGSNDFQAGGMASGDIASNGFGEMSLGSSLRSYYVKVGNTFNGKAEVPPASPTPSTAGC